MLKTNKLLFIILLFLFFILNGCLGENPETETFFSTNPKNLKLYIISSNQIDLSWEAPSNNEAVKGYNVYRDHIFLKYVSTTSTSDTDLIPCNWYCYKVLACDESDNELGQSSEVCAETVPPPPANIRATPENEQIKLTWDDVINTSSYNIYMTTYPGISKNDPNAWIVNHITSNSYDWTDLTNGTVYYFIVTTVEPCGEGYESHEISAIPQAPGIGEDPNVSALIQSVYQLVNEYRESKGLLSMNYNNEIAGQAQKHSENMASGLISFGHDGFNDRINEIQKVIQISAAAENVAYNMGSNPAEVAVESWINSPNHRTNMEGDYNLTGIGISKSQSDYYYFTQIFVRSP